MKYKVLGNSSLPEIRLGLQKGQIIDVEDFNSKTGYEITDKMLRDLERAKVIEKIGKPKEDKKAADNV